MPGVFGNEGGGDFRKWFSVPFEGMDGVEGWDDDKDGAGELNEEERLLLTSRLHQVLHSHQLNNQLYM